MKKLTNDEFLKRLKNKNIKYIPLEEYQGYEVKIKWACLKNTKHIFEATPLNVFGGRGCPYCSHHKVFVGETDMWTTNPKMASMLKDPEDGYKYTENSTHRLYWKCLDCGNILFKSPNTVFRQGLSCDVCSDGISYAERYMISILNQLNIKYLHDVATNWSNGKRYDFYIPFYDKCDKIEKIKIFQTKPLFSLYYITEALQNRQKGRDRSCLAMLESETIISMRYICGISGGCTVSAIYGSETVRMPKMRHRIYSSDGINGG